MFVAALASVFIASCYDGDTRRTNTGERIRLVCIDTPQLRGKRANPQPAIAARDSGEALWLVMKLQETFRPARGFKIKFRY